MDDDDDDDGFRSKEERVPNTLTLATSCVHVNSIWHIFVKARTETGMF